MQISKEIFVIPNRENFILYAPLKGTVLKVNSGTINLLQEIKRGEYNGREEHIVKELKSKGILTDEISQRKIEKNPCEKEVLPTSVTLFPTTNCNLKCIYCYASAGESHIDMNFDIAKASIDFIVQNALKTKRNDISLGFHGGGEPFTNWELMRYSVDYAKKRCEKEKKDLKISAASNGVLSKEKLEWIIENKVRLNISLDGPEDIQNIQRPLKNGENSFDKVISTIRYLDEKNEKYGLRATITQYNVNRMEEMVSFFKNNSKRKSFHFEPVYECGRCSKTMTKEPEPKLFLEKLIIAKEKAKEEETDIYYSGGRFDSINDHFCGAIGKNFFVTPTGKVTSCLEVSKDDDPRIKIFSYGKYENGKFEFDYSKIKYLNSRVIDNLPYCTDCFAKFTCAGDCLAKVGSQNIFDTSVNRRCDINRGLLLYEINKNLDKYGKRKT